MYWIDIASIVFVCVTMNHLGLIKAIEEKTEMEYPILNCAKCSSFWCVLCYTMFMSKQILMPLAVSFLASYIALWLELLEGYVDTLYMKLYGKIYKTSDDTITSDANSGDSAGSVSEL